VIAHLTPVHETDIDDLDVVSVPHGRARRLTPKSVRAEGPDWSPDGKTILLLQARGPERARPLRLKADGSAERRVTKVPLWDSRPTWGP
jgi:Tol biopolymer transport system component